MTLVFNSNRVVSGNTLALGAWTLFFSILFFVLGAQAIDLEWREPQVLGASSMKGRKIVRFSGQTDPNTVIRLQKGTRYYLVDGAFRSFSLPREDRQQFPMDVGSEGTFAFDLNLPVRAIEVPLLLKNGKEERNSFLNFRVPARSVKIEDLSDLEKSYTAQATDDDDRYKRSRGKYTRERDQGQIITRRRRGALRNDDRVQLKRKRLNLKVYGSLGPSWTSLVQDSPDVLYSVVTPGSTLRENRTGFKLAESALVIPVWRLGAYWEMNQKWRFGLSVRDTPLIYEPNENDDPVTFPEGQSNWTTGRLEASYFFKQIPMGWLGLDFGVQLHSQPYYRLRNFDFVFNYEDSLMFDAFVGARIQSHKDRNWPWQAYFHVSVPFYTNSDVFSGSGVGLELGGGADKELMPGLSAGIWGYVQQYFLWTEYPFLQQSTPGTPDQELIYESSYSLTSMTIEARLTVRF